MTTVTLTKTETALLTDAAGRGGLLLLPRSMKAVTAQRLVGRFVRDGLITTREREGATAHHLAGAGYEALGLTLPKATRQPGAKQAAILDLLGRGEGATVDELVAATGWLPHTTRAALSRLRSAGTALDKSRREDGRTSYRILAEPPKPTRRARRAAPAEAAEAAAG